MAVKPARKMVTIVVAVLIFSTFAAEINANHCDKLCGVLCASTASPGLCYLLCSRKCGDSEALVPSELGHCKLGCLASTCFDQRSGEKKVEADKVKAEACADSCSEYCQKSYVPH